jgi:hypothetical protein
LEPLVDNWFELWDAPNANLVGAFETRSAALAVVRRSLASFGQESVESLVLTEEDASGSDPRVIATGAALATLARSEQPSLAGVGRTETAGE